MCNFVSLCSYLSRFGCYTENMCKILASLKQIDVLNVIYLWSKWKLKTIPLRCSLIKVSVLHADDKQLYIPMSPQSLSLQSLNRCVYNI